jgi:hypothetical protein
LAGRNNAGIFLKRKRSKVSARGEIRGDSMPVSKKQLEKLNKVKKAKAEELAKQAAGGSESAKKKLKKLQKKIK